MGDVQAPPRRNRRKLAFLFSTILAVALFAFAGNAGAVTHTGGTGTDPWISSDLPDYPAGAPVDLLGGNWRPGEPVHIHVNDDQGQTWVRDVDVTADANGDISDSFTLPEWFVATYSLTANDGSGAVAQSSFTDSNPSSITVTPSPVTVAPGFTAAYTVSIAAGGNNNPCNVNLAITGLPTGATATFGTNPVPTTGGAGSPYSTSLQIATTPATPTGSSTFTVSGTNSGAGCQGPGPVSGAAVLAVARRIGTVTVGAQAGTLTNGVSGSATYNVTVLRNGASGTAFSADLSVTSSLPAGASASFSPSTLNFAAGDTSKTSTLTITTTASTPAGSTPFTVQANNPGATGDSSTGSGTLTINPACTAPSVTTQPSDQSITYGANASFTAAAGGTSPNAQWQVSTNGGSIYTDLSGQTSSTLTLTKPSVSASGNRYRARFTNSCGTATSNPATLSVAAKNLTITGATAGDKTYDGANAATVNFGSASLVGVVSGDTVTIDHSGYVASFANKNVGTNNPVTVVGVVLGGSDAGNYSVSQPSGLTASINLRDLTVSASGVNKTYDGTTAATVTLSTDKLSGDSVSAAYTSASFADRNAGSGKAVSVSGISFSGADAANYHLTDTTASTSADISQRAITVTAVTDSKTYDGTTNSSATPAITSGTLAPGDSAGFSQAFVSTTVATGKTLVPSGSVNDGNSGNDYAVTFQNDTTGVISAKGLTISGASANDKTYDGNDTATIDWSGAGLNGVVGSDDVSIDHSGYVAGFADKNAGSDKPVTVVGVVLGGSDAGNYGVSQPAGLTASIGQARLDIYAASDSKTYDGTTSSGATPTVGSGQVQTGDSVDGLNQAFQSKNVLGAGNSTVVVTAYSAHDGNSGGNYDVHLHSAPGTIGAKGLTISGASANDKVYDGSTAATVDWSGAGLNGVVGSDDVSIDHSGYSAHFADKNAGSNKPVTVTGIALSAGDAGNYTVSQPSGLRANITPKGLTISGSVANDKVYDGTTSATVDFSSAALNGVASGDTVSIDSSGYSASFATKTIGSSKPVTVTGVALSGGDAGNYTVAQPSGLTANIAARGLTVTAVGINKTYDGTASATVSLFTTAVSGDTVLPSYANASFNNRNAGTGKAVSVSGITISGADAANYSLLNTTGSTTATVYAKNVVGNFTAADKLYDGTTAAVVLSRSLQVLIPGDDVSLSGGTAAFSDPSVGTNKVVTLAGATLTGADAGNYNLNAVNTATASITAWNAAGFGFYQPVGIANSVFVAAPAPPPNPNASTIWNTVKGGSTVPLKFNFYAGAVEKTSLTDIRSFTQQSINCSTGSGSDPVDATTSGNTSLRYDTTAMQWIQNWKTPTGGTNVCYRATVTFADGSSLSAFFRLNR